MKLKRVVLESPYQAGKSGNVEYARHCIRDCLLRGEAPIASHLLYTQPGLLEDTSPNQRKLGISAGHAWIPAADAVVVYTDRGITPGMKEGIKVAEEHSIPVEFRKLP